MKNSEREESKKGRIATCNFPSSEGSRRRRGGGPDEPAVRLITILAAICLTLPGCTTDQSTPERTSHTDTTVSESSTDSEIILAVQPGVYDANRAVMQALIVGRLHVIDGCLHLISEGEDAEGAVIIWPPETSMRMTDEGLVEIIDHAGELIVRVGEFLEIGGGFASSVDGIEFDDPDIGARLREKCPGPYWIAGDIVR